jgi:hypothetical protein
MATYNFRFNEVSMQQVFFEADSLEEAQALFKKCQDDEMNISDLPEVFEKNRGIELDFSCSILESDVPA